MENRVLVVPDQLIDYTSGRLSSFSDRPDTVVQHVDFSYPFTRELSQRILDAASRQNIVVQDGGIYGVTEGPRLETAAEISRMEKDGCDLVGMTLMPEAVLAREAGLDYAALALVVNRAAGKSQELITMDMIKSNLQEGMSQVRSILCGVMAMSVRVCD